MPVMKTLVLCFSYFIDNDYHYRLGEKPMKISINNPARDGRS